MLANPEFFTVETIEVMPIAGKNVFVMTGKHRKTGDREKNVYVSIRDDWKETYEVGIGGSTDAEEFKKQVAKFDKALGTVQWKRETKK